MRLATNTYIIIALFMQFICISLALETFISPLSIKISIYCVVVIVSLGILRFTVKQNAVIQQQAQALQQSKEQLKNLTDNEALFKKIRWMLEEGERLASVGSWDWNMITNEVYWSKQLYEIQGHAEEKGPLGYEDYMNQVHPEDRDALAVKIQQAAEGVTPYIAEYRIFRCDNGEERHFSATGEVFFNSEGKPERLIGSVQDVTERKKTQQALLESQRLSTIGELASGVAHDFNNALQSILFYVDLLLKKEIPPHLKQYLHTVKTSAVDASTRVKFIQRFNQNNGEKSDYETICMNELISEVITQARPLWKDLQHKKGLSLSIESNEMPLLQIQGNASELRSALYNLIKNSVEAMTRDGVININASYSDKKVVVEIQDTGMGMSEETQRKIFQPFFSTKGFEGGRGLGMSNVLSIIKQHHGDIYVKSSELGQGTTIAIKLPCVEHEEQQIVSTKKYGSARVLWVDDDPAIRSVLDAVIDTLEYSGDIAASGQQALEYLQKNTYDIVITDVSMPGMNGWTLAKKINSMFNNTMPIVIVSGWELQKKNLQKYNIRYVLGKPLEIEKIESCVAEIVYGKSACLESSSHH